MTALAATLAAVIALWLLDDFLIFLTERSNP